MLATYLTIILGLRKPFSSLNTPSGSCPASDVQASLQCNGNVGLVRWTAARNAENYIAVATGKDGHTHTCTSSGTNCTFSDLHCGEDYTVTVSTVERGCQSQPTTPVNLRSGQETGNDVLQDLSCLWHYTQMNLSNQFKFLTVKLMFDFDPIPYSSSYLPTLESGWLHQLCYG